MMMLIAINLTKYSSISSSSLKESKILVRMVAMFNKVTIAGAAGPISGGWQ